MLLCRSTEYSAAPDYGRVKALLESMRASKGAAKRGRGSKAWLDAAPSPEAEEKSSRGRLSKGKRTEVIDLVDNDEFDIEPEKPIKKSRATATSKSKASSTAAMPSAAPTVEEDPPSVPVVAKGRSAKAKVLDKTSEEDEVKFVVRVMSGPHEGEVCALPSASQTDRASGRKKRTMVEEMAADMVGIGRTCEDIAAAVFLPLGEDDYVSDR